MKTVSFSKRIANLSTNSASSGRRDAVFLNRELQEREDLCASIGYALVQSPPFQNGSLRLYCGVPAKYLLPQNAPPLHEYLDFVICRDQDALLAVRLSDGGQPSRELRQAFAAQSAKNFLICIARRGTNDTQKIAARITRQLLEPDRAGIKTSFCPIPSELLKSLASPSACVLKVRPILGGRVKLWFPTEYGRSLGILQGFRTDQNNRIRPFLGCARECLDGLQEAAAWGEPGVPAFPQEPMTFDQRLDLVRRGMTLHPEPIMDLIRQLRDMPLTEYFRDYPENLQAFQNVFPDAHTYRQAAACLTEFRVTHGAPMTFLLRSFVQPFLNRADIPLADERLRSVLFAASLLAKSKYLTWTGEMILHDHDGHHIAEKWTYRQWLEWADREIEKYQEDPGEVPTDFYILIDSLIVYPFSEISN